MITENNPIEQTRNAASYRFDKVAVTQAHGRLPFPATMSAASIDLPYPPIGKDLDRDSLFLAQQYARLAMNCKTESARDRYINKANYVLTKAYQGGERHEAFWEQFA